MKIWMDNSPAELLPGQTLLEALQAAGKDADCLSGRPLAAQFGGEVFTLNYNPIDADGNSRRAIQEHGTHVRLLRYRDAAGRAAYLRSLQFVTHLALHRLWPQAVGKVSCSLGSSLYIAVTNCPDFSAARLREETVRLIAMDIPFRRRRVAAEDALHHFHQNGRDDKAALIVWSKQPTFDEYLYEDFADDFYGEMVPSAGYLTVWEILAVDGGFVLLYPDDRTPDVLSELPSMPHYFSVFTEGERWCSLMECENVADLNRLTFSEKLRELIRVNEALHEKRFSQIADHICQRNAKIVMLAGPSSSGKTTSANRLATQLRVHGKKPILMSLDDYYFNRDTLPVGEDGKIDFEHINTIDTALFRQQAKQLLAGEAVILPVYNFIAGQREWSKQELRLNENSVILVEGLHALNPVMLPDGITVNAVFRLYVSPLLPLNLDDHNRIPINNLRLLRRTVRDYLTRGSSVQRTFSMWDSVRQGELRWIYPYQEFADEIFNSSTLYELAVLKKHIYPLLTAIQPDEECYNEVQNLVRILTFVQEADVDDEIPPTSLVREFIGGNTFYRD